MTATATLKLFMGTDIRQSDRDTLQPVELPQLLERIRQPDYQLRQTIAHIRQVAPVSDGGARSLKARLPYVCASEFTNHIRQTRHFRAAYGMFIDLDQCLRNEQDYDNLSQKLHHDNRIALFYRSPSGHGLKLLFAFDKPVTATKTYSDIYKVFAYRFAREYGLEQYLDSHTHDATRVSFLSDDAQAWANTACTPVKTAYFAVPQLYDEQVQPAAGTNEPTAQPDTDQPEQKAVAPDYKRIIARLKGIEKPQKEYFVPAELEKTMPAILAALAENGLQTSETRQIQYGRQLHIQRGPDKAVINVYFGKRGYSVVRTNARGSNSELAEAAELLIWQGIHTYYTQGQQWQNEIDKLQQS